MKPTEKHVALDKSPTVAELPAACADERTAVEFLERKRWGETPTCPRCEATDVYQMTDRKTGERNRRFLWRCRACGDQYTARVGTVFEDSKIPLKHWCYAFWRACTSKKGASALEIKRHTGLTYRSALFMMHRIRFAMAEDHASPPKMTGTIEVDETFVGGKPRYRRHGQGGGASPEHLDRKSRVVAFLQRDGEVRALVHEKVTARTLKDVVRDYVDRSATVMTDEARHYQGLAREFRRHVTVHHKQGEYARADGATTNGVEGFFSLIKRGLYGTYHSVSKRHLHRYVAEFEFRFNHRRDEDGDRTVAAIRAAEGKRLTYRPLLSAGGNSLPPAQTS
jgi:transposase-like protein